MMYHYAIVTVRVEVDGSESKAAIPQAEHTRVMDSVATVLSVDYKGLDVSPNGSRDFCLTRRYRACYTIYTTNQGAGYDDRHAES